MQARIRDACEYLKELADISYSRGSWVGTVEGDFFMETIELLQQLGQERRDDTDEG